MATTIFLVNPREGAVTPPSYLLDTYSATAAYSLRQLKTGVTSVVRVRRSSDNREENFTATEITDGTLAGFCGGGNGFVVTWYDQSGNANDATQSVASSQPRIVLSGVIDTDTNGTPTLYLPTGNSYFNLTSNINEVQQFHNFSVFTRPASGNRTTTSLGAASNDWIFSWATGNARRTDLNTNVSYDTSTSTGLFLQNNNRNSSNGVECWFNGSSIGTGSITTSSFVFTQLLRYSTSGNSAGSLHSEVIYFESDQSSNRTDIESDINTYYSIY